MTTQSKILYILNARWPTVRAYGLQVAKTCEAIAEAGFPVTLVVPRRRVYSSQNGEDPRDVYGIRDTFDIVRLASPDWVIQGPFARIAFIVQQISFAARACWFARRREGVVYSRDAFVLVMSGLMMPKRPRYWELHKWPKRMTFMHRMLLRGVDGLIVISHGLAHQAREIGVETARIAVIPDAVDVAQFDIAHSVHEARIALGVAALPLIGYIGHMSTYGEAKGVDTLIQSMSWVAKRVPDARLVIVGGSDREIASHACIAEQAGVLDRVQFVGTVPHREVPLWLRACDALVIPYPDTRHYSLHMSPLKLFEYMAAGKPIITTDLPSIREIANEADVQFTRPGDAQSLADGICRVLSDPVMLARLGARSYSLARMHTWDIRGTQIGDFIFSKSAV